MCQSPPSQRSVYAGIGMPLILYRQFLGCLTICVLLYCSTLFGLCSPPSKSAASKQMQCMVLIRDVRKLREAQGSDLAGLHAPCVQNVYQRPVMLRLQAISAWRDNSGFGRAQLVKLYFLSVEGEYAFLMHSEGTFTIRSVWNKATVR